MTRDNDREDQFVAEVPDSKANEIRRQFVVMAREQRGPMPDYWPPKISAEPLADDEGLDEVDYWAPEGTGMKRVDNEPTSDSHRFPLGENTEILITITWCDSSITVAWRTIGALLPDPDQEVCICFVLIESQKRVQWMNLGTPSHHEQTYTLSSEKLLAFQPNMQKWGIIIEPVAGELPEPLSVV